MFQTKLKLVFLMVKKSNNVLITQSPNRDGIGRYVSELGFRLKVDISYTNNILSPMNFFRIYFGYKIVHFPHFIVPLFKLPGQKFVTTIQDITPLLHKDLNLLKRSYLFVRIFFSLLRSDHVIFTSNYVSNKCREIFKIKYTSSIIPLGVDYNFFAKRRAPIYENGKYFLIVGRRRSNKNTINMAIAFAKARIDTSIKLIFVGKKRKTDKELLNIIERFGIVNRVLFTENLTDDALAAMYQHATGLLFVSRFEGFGLPVLEAMASGCPVITSTSTSLPEVAGVDAFFANPDDVGQIKTAIETCATEGISEERRKSAMQRALEFSWERTSKETSVVYKNLYSFSKTE